jgi:RNA polymerase sigma-70 factor (ECF subfamily)
MSTRSFEDRTLQKTSDAELVRASLTGDKDAYGSLYDRYAPLVRAVCYDYARNVPDAQDLAQDVFLRAYSRLSQLRKPESFGSWIVGMARLRCAEWRRQIARQRDRHARVGSAAGVETRPDDGEQEELRRAIAELPEKERLALHAFYTLGQSADNACEIVGLSRSGFYRVLDRTRKRLRRLLAQERRTCDE